MTHDDVKYSRYLLMQESINAWRRAELMVEDEAQGGTRGDRLKKTVSRGCASKAQR
jgi:hypothetical protein